MVTLHSVSKPHIIIIYGLNTIQTKSSKHEKSATNTVDQYEHHMKRYLDPFLSFNKMNLRGFNAKQSMS